MPSRPLSADTSAVVKLQTRLDNEAIDLAKGRTEMPAAAAALLLLRQLVDALPPSVQRAEQHDRSSVGGRSRPYRPRHDSLAAGTRLLRPDGPWSTM